MEHARDSTPERTFPLSFNIEEPSTYAPGEIETPKYSYAFKAYSAIHVEGSRRVRRIRPSPWFGHGTGTPQKKLRTRTW